MASLNKVMLIGRLGKDPEVRHFDSGAMKVTFTMATSERYTKKDGERVENTEWHNIVVWRKGLNTVAEKYLRKGKEIFLEGKIKTRSWDDQNGQKRYTTEIEAENFTMLGSASDNRGDGGNSGYSNQSYGGGNQQQSQQPTKMEPAAPQDDFGGDDDLPF